VIYIYIYERYIWIAVLFFIDVKTYSNLEMSSNSPLWENWKSRNYHRHKKNRFSFLVKSNLIWLWFSFQSDHETNRIATQYTTYLQHKITTFARLKTGWFYMFFILFWCIFILFWCIFILFWCIFPLILVHFHLILMDFSSYFDIFSSYLSAFSSYFDAFFILFWCIFHPI